MDPFIETSAPIGAASIALVRHTFALVAPNAELAAERFYANLFAAHPGLRELFHGDMRAQGRKLMEMLDLAVRMLDHPWTVMPELRKLGERHVRYGVEPRHFGAVRTALIKTLEDTLGDDFGAEEHDAWVYVFDALAKAMQPATGAPPVTRLVAPT